MKPSGISWKIYLRNGLGRRASTFGQRIGSEWLSYNPWVMRQFHDTAVWNAPKVVNAFNQVFPGIKRVFDVGAGSGAFRLNFGIADARCWRANIPLMGGNSPGCKLVESLAFDLAQVPPCAVQGEFDVVYCLRSRSTRRPISARTWFVSSSYSAPPLFLWPRNPARAAPGTSTSSRFPIGARVLKCKPPRGRREDQAATGLFQRPEVRKLV